MTPRAYHDARPTLAIDQVGGRQASAEHALGSVSEKVGYPKE
jgi:hypothetical protein